MRAAPRENAENAENLSLFPPQEKQGCEQAYHAENAENSENEDGKNAENAENTENADRWLALGAVHPPPPPRRVKQVQCGKLAFSHENRAHFGHSKGLLGFPAIATQKLCLCSKFQ